VFGVRISGKRPPFFTAKALVGAGEALKVRLFGREIRVFLPGSLEVRFFGAPITGCDSGHR